MRQSKLPRTFTRHACTIGWAPEGSMESNMSDAGSAVRNYQAALAREREGRDRDIKQLQRDARRLRFAWIEGHHMTCSTPSNVTPLSCRQYMHFMQPP